MVVFVKRHKIKIVEELIKRLEDWSGFSLAHVNMEDAQEVINEINTLRDTMTNQISDQASRFEKNVRELLPEED
jgi:hypothetical protein